MLFYSYNIYIHQIIRIIKKENVFPYLTYKSSIYTNSVQILHDHYNSFVLISSIIVNKSKWQSVKKFEKWIGSLYVHLYIIFNLMKKGLKIKVINNRIIGYTNNNDSLANEKKKYEKLKLEMKLYRRAVIDIEPYYIAREVFGKDSKEQYIIKSKLIKKFATWNHIVEAKINNASLIFYYKYFLTLFKLYYYHPLLYLWYIPLFFVPQKFFSLGLHIKTYKDIDNFLKYIKEVFK